MDGGREGGREGSFCVSHYQAGAAAPLLFYLVQLQNTFLDGGYLQNVRLSLFLVSLTRFGQKLGYVNLQIPKQLLLLLLLLLLHLTLTPDYCC
jgi:hypothetical protein